MASRAQMLKFTPARRRRCAERPGPPGQRGPWRNCGGGRVPGQVRVPPGHGVPPRGPPVNPPACPSSRTPRGWEQAPTMLFPAARAGGAAAPPGRAPGRAEPELLDLGELSGGRSRACCSRTACRAQPHPVGRLGPARRPHRADAAAGARRRARRRARPRRDRLRERHGALSRVTSRAGLPLRALDRRLLLPARDDRRRRARRLLDSATAALIDRAVPRLTCRDPAESWTSGQWMTERTGGSDVGASPRPGAPGGDGQLAALRHQVVHLAPPRARWRSRSRGREGNPPGGRGLALFYLELRDAERRSSTASWSNRLKDKLGTRKVPTAELALDGTRADAGRAASPTASATSRRCSTSPGRGTPSAPSSGMRRGLALATRLRAPARRVRRAARRQAAPRRHARRPAGGVRGRLPAGVPRRRAARPRGGGETTDEDEPLLRMLTPLGKLTTGKQAVAVASEVLEAFGGAGYVEDTGLPRAAARRAGAARSGRGRPTCSPLDALRALAAPGLGVARARGGAAVAAGGTRARRHGRGGGEAAAHAAGLARGRAATPGRRARGGARRFALTLGRALELALLVAHAQWWIVHGRGGRVRRRPGGSRARASSSWTPAWTRPTRGSSARPPDPPGRQAGRGAFSRPAAAAESGRVTPGCTSPTPGRRGRP